MKIEINTRFDIGDIAYGFYDKRIYKFRIDGFTIRHQDGEYVGTEISYYCTAVPFENEKWECTFHQTFEEYQLCTYEEIKEVFNVIQKDKADD